jgi:hypothetical protein
MKEHKKDSLLQRSGGMSEAHEPLAPDFVAASARWDDIACRRCGKVHLDSCEERAR